MAPEVIDGKQVGAPADIFSVGTTLYWLVCGSLPFSGPNPSALFRRILESKFDAVSPGDLAPDGVLQKSSSNVSLMSRRKDPHPRNYDKS